jgi:2-polyprenyl-3-methyl-5-hydroxy-6-metoxy-1,4-benzoquinol methylase
VRRGTTAADLDEERDMTVDEGKLNELLGRFVIDCGGSYQAISAVIGDRLGLYRALQKVMPATSAEVATAAGVGERYAREWLRCQAAGGYITFDSGTERFLLSDEQAFALASPDGMQIAAAFHLPVAVCKNIERIAEAIRTNGAFGWQEHDPALYEGVERFFRPGYVANLVSSWIPALDGVEQRLRDGARVADVACGHGASTLLLAESYTRSSITGYDNHDPSIEQARKRAAEAGLSAQVTFEVAAAADYPGTDYDLVTIFDALHDMPDPLVAARHVHDSLKSDGTFLLVEPFAQDRVEDNFNPVGRLYYGASTVICIPHSMTEQPRTALGAQAGEAQLTTLLTEAGFSRVRRAAQTPFNLIIEARP